MKTLRNPSVLLLLFFICFSGSSGCADPARTPNIQPKATKDLLTIDNGMVKVGIDREMGASLTYLSWSKYPKNVINIHDPGRLIQQSYYAGKRLDRSADGQSKAWSPLGVESDSGWWEWVPWAKVNEFKIIKGSPGKTQTLFGETIPKLWDMPNEDADAVMRQWTTFEPDMPDVVTVRCELICKRAPKDRWGPAVTRHQEVPACYFTRNFSRFRSYLGEGKWRCRITATRPTLGKSNPASQGHGLFQFSGKRHHDFQPLRYRALELRPTWGRQQFPNQRTPRASISRR